MSEHREDRIETILRRIETMGPGRESTCVPVADLTVLAVEIRTLQAQAAELTNPVLDGRRIEYLEESLHNCSEALQKAQQDLASARARVERST